MRDGIVSGRLALLGLGDWRDAAYERERDALAARGYACVPLGHTVDSIVASVLTASAIPSARGGRAPPATYAFACEGAGSIALEVAEARPDLLHGIVLRGVAAHARVPELARFAACGGRIVLVHDACSSRTSLDDAIALLEELERRAGGAVPASAFVRLFVLPRSGDVPADGTAARVDLASAIERWLEWTPRRPPDVLVRIETRAPGQSLFAPAPVPATAVDGSRPAYPYPLRSLYKGRGDRTDWRNWYAPGIYRRTPDPPAAAELPQPLPQEATRRRAVVVRDGIGPVVVFGASGRLGLELVSALRAHGVQVRAAVRDAAKAAAKLPPEVEVAVADVRDAVAVGAVLDGARDVVFAASATAGGDADNVPATVELAGLSNVIAAARTRGIAHFVLISSAACTQPEHVHNLWGGILDCKRRSEVALRASGLPYTVLRPTGLRPAPGLEPYGAGTRGIRFIQGDRIAFGEEIHRADVAALCVALLEHPAAFGTTFEAYNDDTLPPDSWPEAIEQLRPD